MLRELLGKIPEASSMNVSDASVGETNVTAVTYDSRQAGPGSVFVALRGANADGASFARDALNRGAVAVVSEISPPRDVTRPWIQVPDARLSLAALSATLYDNPSEELTLVGITGTNGKTTTSYLLASIFEAAGVRCGRIGTVGYRIGTREFEAARTTPEAPDLQRMLREMVTDGCGACVMEVSSHALTLRRADRLHFAAAIFTNLTRDHLDFHRDMEAYFVAKRRLAELLPDTGIAVTNLDDPRGRDFAATASRATGDPEELLTARTEKLDLLVMGSRGYGPLHAVLVGGLSGRMVRTAHCPVNGTRPGWVSHHSVKAVVHSAARAKSEISWQPSIIVQ